MNKTLFIPGLFVGVAIGLIIAIILLNRYEPLQVNKLAGRLDKLTGDACVFIDKTEVSSKEALSIWGLVPC